MGVSDPSTIRTPEKKNGLQGDKGYRVTSAVHRMLDRGKIDRHCAVELLVARAKTQPNLAKAVVEMWVNNPPRRFPFQMNKSDA